MRSTLIILLLIAGSCAVQAQSKRDSSHAARVPGMHNIYVDLSLSPGFSVTYTRKFARHFDMGVGLSSYYRRHWTYGNSRSSLYLDFRPHWGRKGLFFFITDIGMTVNAGPQPNLATMSPLGVYATLGFGYCYRINKRGMGPYISMGLYDETTNIRDTYPPPPPRSRERTISDGYGIISLGFKF